MDVRLVLKILALLIFMFMVGFVGDLCTQWFAKSYDTKAKLFSSFWEKNGSIKSATMAGFITLLCGGLFLFLAVWTYDHYQLDIKTWSFIIFSAAIGYVLGVMVDASTNRQRWIPELQDWYEGVGATLATTWTGGICFAVVMFFSSWFLTKIV